MTGGAADADGVDPLKDFTAGMNAGELLADLVTFIDWVQKKGPPGVAKMGERLAELLEWPPHGEDLPYPLTVEVINEMMPHLWDPRQTLSRLLKKGDLGTEDAVQAKWLVNRIAELTGALSGLRNKLTREWKQMEKKRMTFESPEKWEVGKRLGMPTSPKSMRGFLKNLIDLVGRAGVNTIQRAKRAPYPFNTWYWKLGLGNPPIISTHIRS